MAADGRDRVYGRSVPGVLRQRMEAQKRHKLCFYMPLRQFGLRIALACGPAGVAVIRHLAVKTGLRATARETETARAAPPVKPLLTRNNASERPGTSRSLAASLLQRTGLETWKRTARVGEVRW